MRRGLDRRTFLRGAGGALLGLPLLQAMSPLRGRARAAGLGGFPKRFITIFTSNGFVRNKWTPTGTGPSFTLSPTLAPLVDHKADLLVLSGLDMNVGHEGPGDGHQVGMGAMLTGRPLESGPFQNGVGFASGPSIDQVMAQKWGAETRFPSLELGVVIVPDATQPITRFVYRDAAQPLSPECDPFAVYTRLFGDALDPAAAERTRLQRRSVIDSVKSSFDDVRRTVGADDRARLDAHADAIRRIEGRLTAPLDASCTPPEPGVAMDPLDPANYAALGTLQMDLIAHAFACDLTRVVTLQWSRAGSQIRFPWLGIDETHHTLAHAGDSNTAAKDKLARIDRWYAEQLAYLIASLKALPEGDGTVFDNTVILWVTELAKGNTHTVRDMQFLLAGSAGAYFATGRHLTYDAVPHNNLLVSLLNAMEIPATTFGLPSFCTGPLANLT